MEERVCEVMVKHKDMREWTQEEEGEGEDREEEEREGGGRVEDRIFFSATNTTLFFSQPSSSPPQSAPQSALSSPPRKGGRRKRLPLLKPGSGGLSPMKKRRKNVRGRSLSVSPQKAAANAKVMKIKAEIAKLRVLRKLQDEEGGSHTVAQDLEMWREAAKQAVEELASLSHTRSGTPVSPADVLSSLSVPPSLLGWDPVEEDFTSG